MGASKVALALAAAGVALAACGRPAPTQPAARAETPVADPGYRGPPAPLQVIRTADGAVSLTGRAIPSSTVRMVSPAGSRVETTADGSGAWTVALGPVSEPTLYRVAEEIAGPKEGSGQRIEAEGYVAVTPGAAAVLRAGAGAVSLDPVGPGLRLQAVDFDSGGATVVSGRAPAGQPVRVSVDGMLSVEGAAGADGRFSLTLPKPLDPGAHTIGVATPKAAAAAKVTLSAPAPPSDGPYKAVADSSGWRLDWLTPGGGPQTTLLVGG